jgi:hypothetical protein
MAAAQPLFSGSWRRGVFILLQVAVMLLAISNESLWIDEFWTAHFAALGSFKDFFELLLVPSGSQTPLHFLHFYLWGQVAPAGEFVLRLANLPLFVAGQAALYFALRDYPRPFAWTLLALGALHPMLWQYANEARPYVMLVAGSQMVLAYLLHLHAGAAFGRTAQPVFLLCFVLGSILLFGASLLGSFWVLSASVWLLLHHLQHKTWRQMFRGLNLLLLGLFLLVIGSLTVYYLNSLLRGAGASRLASSTPSTALFAAYEMLGLAGVGPGRLALRSLGPAALAPYAPGLLAAACVLLAVLALGLKAAHTRLGTYKLLLLGALGLFPVAVVLSSGFVMHWRVLGRHLIAALPVLNLVLALGLIALWQAGARAGQGWRRGLAAAAALALMGSSLALRFSPEHRKDDYRAAAAAAQAALAQGQRVWWAAGVIGARYYGLTGEFDVMGELTSQHKPVACHDQSAVQSVVNAPMPCLLALTRPDLVVLSKPETFDTQGAVSAYLNAQRFAMVQVLPAFTLWRRAESAP